MDDFCSRGLNIYCIVGVGQSFIAGFAACIANPTLIRFPLYVAGKKTGKLQLKKGFQLKPEQLFQGAIRGELVEP